MGSVRVAAPFDRETLLEKVANDGVGELVGVRALIIGAPDAPVLTGWLAAAREGFIELDPDGTVYYGGTWTGDAPGRIVENARRAANESDIGEFLGVRPVARPGGSVALGYAVPSIWFAAGTTGYVEMNDAGDVFTCGVWRPEAQW